MVAIACVQMLALVGMTYDQVALAAGNSRGYFALTCVRTVLQIGCLLAGAVLGGLVGALAGQALAIVLAHPFVAWLAARHGAWDPVHDAGYALIGGTAAAAALWLNREALMALAAVGG